MKTQLVKLSVRGKSSNHEILLLGHNYSCRLKSKENFGKKPGDKPIMKRPLPTKNFSVTKPVPNKNGKTQKAAGNKSSPRYGLVN